MKEEKECGMIVCHGQFPGKNGANCWVPHALSLTLEFCTY